jgi:hypothetical protein
LSRCLHAIPPSATGGHVLLLEHLEEHPALLGRPGMGARLSTYYQKKDENVRSRAVGTVLSCSGQLRCRSFPREDLPVVSCQGAVGVRHERPVAPLFAPCRTWATSTS